MLKKVLVKTTIQTTEDDWHVGRFSLLTEHLEKLRGPNGEPLYDVTAHDRLVDEAGDDVDLQKAAKGEFDQIWLFATDVVDALTTTDVDNLARFRASGGGLLITRDHQDLGACLSKLGALGRTQHFQTVNPEDDEARHCCDDVETPMITWPNYHSGRNGDLQHVETTEPLHPIMRLSNGEPIRRLPAHPHEGAVGVPANLQGQARVIARGKSQTSGNSFNLAVAVEEPGKGRAVSDSSFHHFADYNWDPRKGCPSFVTEPEGDMVLREPHALDDVRSYVANAAAWLSGTI